MKKVLFIKHRVYSTSGGESGDGHGQGKKLANQCSRERSRPKLIQWILY